MRQVCILLLGLSVCCQMATLSSLGAAEKLTSRASFSGTVPEGALRDLAPPGGVITDEETFRALYRAWFQQPQVSPTPSIDFETELVLIGTVPGPNRVILRPELRSDGDVRFVVGGTKKGGPGFGFLLMVVAREGVKSINGRPLEEGHVLESITVTVVGTINSGVVAIGGETTGATITARGVTWELELGEDKELLQSAESLDGKPVIVQGGLEHRAGVEIKDRWIVHVTSLQAIVK